MRIVWDEPKRRATLAVRQLDFTMVTLDFFLDAKIQDAEKDRLLWIGMIGGRTYAVVFEVLGTEAISIISLRRASRKERRLP